MQLKPIRANMAELELDDSLTILFSYETPVAMYMPEDDTYYRTTKKWSNTTTRHINQWLDGSDAKDVDQTVLDTLLKKEK